MESAARCIKAALLSRQYASIWAESKLIWREVVVSMRRRMDESILIELSVLQAH
jgi:hypothetical protein